MEEMAGEPQVVTLESIHNAGEASMNKVLE